MKGLPKLGIDILCVSFVALCFFYFFYDEIPSKFRFFGTSILSIICSIGIYLGLSILSAYIANKREIKLAATTCREAGVHPDSQSDIDVKTYRHYLVNRYSSEKFTNRITDLIGSLILIISILVEITIVISIISLLIYLPINGFYSDDFLMWMPIMWYVIFWMIISVASFLCKLFFNRYPGEAKAFNKKYDH
ncbi:hypothetical protein AB7188_08015 [Providencia rettgeri]